MMFSYCIFPSFLWNQMWHMTKFLLIEREKWCAHFQAFKTEVQSGPPMLSFSLPSLKLWTNNPIWTHSEDDNAWVDSSGEIRSKEAWSFLEWVHGINWSDIMEHFYKLLAAWVLNKIPFCLSHCILHVLL